MNALPRRGRDGRFDGETVERGQTCLVEVPTGIAAGQHEGDRDALLTEASNRVQSRQAEQPEYGTEKLWVSLDQTNFKPPADPAHPEHDHKGFIHWDTDTSLYPNIAFRVQAVLALTDTAANMGGFQCIPEMYRELGAWIERQPADRNGFCPDLTGYEITKLAMKAGDLVIWTTLLPHGNGHNVSDRPRLAQYISMNSAEEANAELRETRIACWRDKRPMPSRAFPGDPRGIEQQSAPAQLTSLGRKLLGSDRWPAE